MASFNVTGACDATVCQRLLFFLMPANLTTAEDSSPLITWGPPGAWIDSPDGDFASQVSLCDHCERRSQDRISSFSSSFHPTARHRHHRRSHIPRSRGTRLLRKVHTRPSHSRVSVTTVKRVSKILFGLPYRHRHLALWSEETRLWSIQFRCGWPVGPGIREV